MHIHRQNSIKVTIIFVNKMSRKRKSLLWICYKCLKKILLLLLLLKEKIFKSLNYYYYYNRIIIHLSIYYPNNWNYYYYYNRIIIHPSIYYPNYYPIYYPNNWNCTSILFCRWFLNNFNNKIKLKKRKL